MARIELDNLVKRYGKLEVLHDINLNIADGEFVVLVGPSGCGKSTLLRMIAGLEPISGGELRIEGHRMNEVPPRDRDIAMVFQSYALYPHMDVGRNMGFSLEIQHADKSTRQNAIDKAASTLGLNKLLDRLPKALSGGQRQRVAMGRAIVRQPQVFLFDEPLSNLDASLRVEMRLEIARLHQKLGATMVYVTHDQVEALTLADRIVIMNDGIIQQVGTPMELYSRPANRFVAQFIGSPAMNVFDVRPSEKGVQAGVATFDLPGFFGLNQAVQMGIRPEHIAIADDNAHVRGNVDVVEQLGSDTNIYVDVEGLGPILVRHHGHIAMKSGDNIGLRFDPVNTHVFKDDGQVIAQN